MIGNIAADFLTAEIVHVLIMSDHPDPDPRMDLHETWSGVVRDVQPFGLMMLVLSINQNGQVTAYCERAKAELRFLPWHRVRHVIVRDEVVGAKS